MADLIFLEPIMKKFFISGLLMTSMILSPGLRAEEVAEDPIETSQGTPVGLASQDGAKTAKSKQWQNIALAVGAVAVAVTALVLVANNDGHHHSSSH